MKKNLILTMNIFMMMMNKLIKIIYILCCIRRDEHDIKLKYNIDIKSNDLISDIVFSKIQEI